MAFLATELRPIPVLDFEAVVDSQIRKAPLWSLVVLTVLVVALKTFL